MDKPINSGVDFWEQVAKVASEEFADMAKHVMKTEAPRPFGSEKVSADEQHMTYQLLKDDPDGLFRFFAENQMKFETAVKWIAEMRDRGH